MKNLVIIGGGFAGTKIAKSLQNYFSTTLIDTKDYFEFTPSILKVLTNPRYAKKIQSKHYSYLKNTRIIKGEVKKITKTSVKIKNKSLPYDYLVIASGSDYASPIKEKNISSVSRSSHLKKANKKLLKSKTIAIVGAGAVGIELAGEIKKEFPNKKITIYTSDSEPLKRNKKKTKELITKYLKKKKYLF